MSPGGGLFIPAALAVGLILAILEGAHRRLVALPLAAAVVAALAYGLPALIQNPVVAMVAVAAAYALRFVAIAGIALHLVATTSANQLTAALRAVRMPRAITVSTAVMLRFLPVIGTEARAVRDAMRLRGIGDWRDMARHPVLSIERFTVPLMASTLRVGEDLSAAALLRGLGSRTRPTTMHPLRFGAFDSLIVAITAVLVVATLLWSPVVL